MHCNFLAATRQVALKDFLHRLAIFLPNSLLICTVVDVADQGLGEGKRGLDLGSAVEEPFLLIRNEIVQDFLEVSGSSCVEGEARKREYGLPQEACVHP